MFIKNFRVHQRYILIFMSFLSLFFAFCMRVSLSVAITEMTLPLAETETNSTDQDMCPDYDTANVTETKLVTGNRYAWSEEVQGIILSSFFWGYIVTHIPGGLLVESFGGKYTLGFSVFVSASSILAIPIIVHVSNGNWVWLVVLRVIQGLAEGVIYPALNNLLAHWVPLSDRAKLGTITFSGGHVGLILGNIISGALIEVTGTWSSVFYLFGGLAMGWFLVWMVLCYSSPKEHPFISQEELDYLQKEIDTISQEKLPIPWLAILKSGPVWGMIVCQFGHDWGFYTMVTDLPKYLKDVLKFNVKNSGIFSSFPYILMSTVAILMGFVSDYLINNKILSIKVTRKLFTTIAQIFPGLFMVLASYCGCNRNLAVWMFILAMGTMGPYTCGLKINALDLAPNFAATLMALVNGLGGSAGIIATYLVGVMTPNQSLLEWRLVFWVSFVMLTATNLFYLIVGSGKVQKWNYKKDEKTVQVDAKEQFKWLPNEL